MPIRITGLNSGLDTEAIISALVSSYSYKTNKLIILLIFYLFFFKLISKIIFLNTHNQQVTI